MEWNKLLPAVMLGVGVTFSISVADVQAKDKLKQNYVEKSEDTPQEPSEGTSSMKQGDKQKEQDLAEKTISTQDSTEKNVIEDGWHKEGEYWYFYQNGDYIRNQIIELKDTNGDYGLYHFDEIGHMTTEQWIQDNYNVYYFGANGRAYIGKHEIEGEYYLFDEWGELRKNTNYIYDNVYYNTDENGIIIYEKSLPNSGWVKIKDRWAYRVQNGNLLTRQWFQENGVWYYFDGEGLALVGEQGVLDSSGQYNNYYFDKNGHMLTDFWFTNEHDQKFYYGSNGRRCSGKQTIDGVNYLFEEIGDYLVINQKRIIKNTYYETDNNGVITYEQVISGSGWLKVKDDWVYIDENNELLCNEWLEENGEKYYFDCQGIMVTGLYSIYDEASAEDLRYYFGNDGRMVRNSWISTIMDKYYFGSDGAGYTGKRQIDDEFYLFNEYAALQRAYHGVIDNVYYETDFNGIIIYEQAITGTGWIKVRNRWAYVNQDGTLKQNCWFEFEGNKYYFDWNCLTVIGYYGYYDTEAQESFNYYFDEYGRMVKNTWIEDNNSRYYFGSDGRGYVGKHEIDGKNYFFTDGSYLARNYSGIFENVYYETNEEGIIIYEQAITGTGWIKLGDKWAYVDNNGQLLRDTWFQENGIWYYFDWKGLTMVGLNNIYDDAGNSYYYYYFDKNGHMQKNVWIEDNNSIYYFGSDGRAYVGKHEIDGKKYFFTENSYLARNYSGIFGNVYYETNEEGIIIYEQAITGTGWIKVRNRWAYVNQDGTLKKDSWYLENGIWYYFDWNGLTMVGLNYIYDDATQKSYNYYFNERGQMQKNVWIEDEYGKYYFGSDGRGYEGKHEIDGIIYLFSTSSNLMNDFVGVIDDTYYRTDGNGIVVFEKKVEGTGWIKLGDKWAYVDNNGQLLRDTWFQENGIWYYFDWKGLTMVGLNNIYDYDTDNSYYYYFDKNGHMLVNQWINSDYNTYYVGNNGRAYTGKAEINGANYLFDESGILLKNISYTINGVYYETNGEGVIVYEQAITGSGWIKVRDRWAYVDENGEFLRDTWFQENGIWYYFDWDGFTMVGLNNIYDDATGNSYYYYFNQNGHMITDYWFLTNSYQGKNWMYFDSTGKAVIGLQEINNKKYYFDDEGCSVPNYRVVLDGIYYVTNINGQVIQEYKLKTNCWEYVGNAWYYLGPDGLPFKGFKNINGIMYYFDENGRMMTDLIYIDDYLYSFGDNGHMIINAWWQDKQDPEKNWYYFGEDGKGHDGWLNSTYYLYDGRMCTGLQIIDNNYYLFDNNGRLVSKNIFVPGWNLTNGKYYYFENNDLVFGWKKVDNKWYYFDEDDGQMATNVMVYFDSYSCFFMQSGEVLTNGWKLYYGNYIYADEDGKLVDGWKKINEIWYYFDGYYMVNNNMIIDDKYHKFASNGKWLGEATLDGWVYDYGWKYISNGKYLTGWQLFANRWYYFDEYGYSIQNQIYVIDNECYYFLEDGTMTTVNGWLKTNNGKCIYLNDNHRVMLGWKKINGVWYYLQPEMATGVVLIEGKYHNFDTSGAWLGQNSQKDGWYRIGNQYYYFKNNELLSDQWIKSGTDYYYLSSDGAMQTGLLNNYGLKYYFDNNGRMLTEQWIKINDKWIYVDELGKVQINVTLIIDGKTYRFDENGFMC